MLSILVGILAGLMYAIPVNNTRATRGYQSRRQRLLSCGCHQTLSAPLLCQYACSKYLLGDLCCPILSY
jgi:hypothetical protein